MKFLILIFSLVVAFMFIFLKGYFPINHKNAPIIDPPVEIDDVPLDLEKFYKPQVKKMILMIIDALRYDFITEKNMPFLYTHMDMLLKVKVEAPTVTLPRIKALTTGAVPQFIDIVLNLGAKAKVADSFLHRAHANGKKMIFYGDNTWEMMFPNIFMRSEGTTSFFVNDFSEVDDNVTRHIDTELKKASEWDMMFLHYLGLDHIGHVRGPFSSLIPLKLKEMDNIIKRIITAVDTWEEETIILITGDHGMKDTGGHGGTTYPETHVPLAIHRNKRNFGNLTTKSTNILQQSDIANTMSALFGLAMPANSIGKVLPQLLTCNEAQLLYTLYYNSLILQRNVDFDRKYERKLTEARKLFKHVVLTSTFQSGKKADKSKSLFTESLGDMSNDLIQSSVNQDIQLLLFGIFGTINCFLIALFPEMSTKVLHISFTIFILVIFVIQHSWTFFYSQTMQLVLVQQMGIFTFLSCLKSGMEVNFSKVVRNNIVNLIPIAFHGILLLSSSYIEEEHYIYYYFVCTSSVSLAFLSYQRTRSVSISTALPLTVIEIVRMCRGIEASKDWYLKDENFIVLKLIHIIGLIATFVVLYKFDLLRKYTKIWLFSTFFCIHLHKFYLERSVTFAQVIWLLIALQFLFAFKKSNSFLILWISIMTFQLRPYNVVLIPAILLCSHIFKKALHKSSVQSDYFLILIHIWLGYTFFFIQGHRNSIADFDLAPSYIGLSSYVPILVGILSLLHSHGFQTLSLILLFDILSKKHSKTKGDDVKVWHMLLLYKIFILLVIYFVIFINRGHLFIWSVFAPKLLIESIHTFVLYLQLLLYSGWKCLYSICKRKRERRLSKTHRGL